jgi:hypothetical protein
LPDENILPATPYLTAKLPSREPDHVWAGSGGGAECPICDLPVTTEQGDSPGTDSFAFHFRCLAAWGFERAKRPPVNRAYFKDENPRLAPVGYGVALGAVQLAAWDSVSKPWSACRADTPRLRPPAPCA